MLEVDCKVDWDRSFKLQMPTSPSPDGGVVALRSFAIRHLRDLVRASFLHGTALGVCFFDGLRKPQNCRLQNYALGGANPTIDCTLT